MPPTTSNREMMALVATSVAAGAAAASLYFYGLLKDKSDEYFKIPTEIRTSPLCQHAKLAVDLALKAGGKMVAFCDEKGTTAELSHNLDVAFKGIPEDFATRIDVENESLVMDGIQKEFPNHKIIGEETCGTGEIPPLTREPTWIIDPIDGTTNFASGLPLACVSIGFCVGGKPVLGVVYSPMTKELYIAAAGYGSFRNGMRIMSKKQETPLSRAVVCFEFGYSRKPEQVVAMVGVVERILNHGCRATRQFGSGVLDLCYVATGRLDVVYAGVAGEGWKPWDFCAGLLIAKEAGCLMESFDQNPSEDFDLYSQNHICATNRGLLEEVRIVIRAK